MIIFSRKNPWLLGTTILGNTHMNHVSKSWDEGPRRRGSRAGVAARTQPKPNRTESSLGLPLRETARGGNRLGFGWRDEEVLQMIILSISIKWLYIQIYRYIKDK